MSKSAGKGDKRRSLMGTKGGGDRGGDVFCERMFEIKCLIQKEFK